jgi:hypothetical protein
MVGAELVGALISYRVESSFAKKAMACIGLGFAYAIVFGDILPDTTQHYQNISPMVVAMVALGLALTFALNKIGKHFGSYTGILGFSIHNLCEGFILTIVQALSPVRFLAFLLHKLPEGMSSYALLDGLKPKVRLAVILVSSLMIPLGACLPISDESPASRPFTAFAAGVILAAVTTSLRMVLSESILENRRYKLAFSLASGMCIGGLSCVLFH